MTDKNQKEVLVSIEGLKKHFPIRKGVFLRHVGDVKAVDGVGFNIYRGETLGLVGESGCGKSTTGRTILQLLEPTDGAVYYKDKNLVGMNAAELRSLRQEMQIIFQDPYASLNPRKTIGRSIGEPMEIHNIGNTKSRLERVRELLDLVGLNANFYSRFPHEFSGGQRQRIGIARALATNPEFIVADEPISALDVSIQAQVVNLMDDLKRQFGLTYLFIAHDLSMVRYISDRVAVMYLGRIVELGECDTVYNKPLHPYTQALLSSIPIPNPKAKQTKKRIILEGGVPSPSNPPSGCHFHPRCRFASEICEKEDPEFRNLGTIQVEHYVACHHAEQFVVPS
jgi:oligopeptide transport system ATP-binding protein